MPDPKTTQAAQRDLKEGKSPSTAAGEFVHREIDKIREGEHGAKNAKQAIAIGLSEARRAGVPIPDKHASASRSGTKRASSGSRKKSSSSTSASRRGSSSKKGSSKRSARSSSSSKSRSTRGTTSSNRSRAALKALKKLPRRAASHLALSRHAHAVARKRSAASRSASAKKAARTRAR